MIWNNKLDNLVVWGILSGLLFTTVGHCFFDHIDISKDAIVENIYLEIEKATTKESAPREPQIREDASDDLYIYITQEQMKGRIIA